MKIVYYSSHPNLGLYDEAGYATHMRKVIEALESEGHEVKRLIAGGELKPEKSSRSRNKSARSKFKRFVPSIIWETLKDIKLRRHDKKMGKELEKLLVEFKPDFTYERINYFQDSGVKICKKLGVNHIAEINSPYTEERKVLQGKSFLLPRANRIERNVLLFSDSIIVVSTALKNYFSSKVPACASKINVIPNAVDNSISNISELPNFSTERLQDKIVIGFVGSIAPWHGIDRLLVATKQLITVREDFLVLIVGGGENLEMYKMLANELKIGDFIIWTGSIKHEYVNYLIDKMDITVMPDSNWYGSPIKIFEYGLFKKPIIAPNYIPLQDVIINHQEGILIDNDERALSNAILQLMQDEKLREQYGNAFYNKILSNFTWKQVGITICNLANTLREK